MKQNRRSFLCNSALAGGAIALQNFASKAQSPVGAALPLDGPERESSESATIRQQFQSPPKKYRPLVRWWWPGNDVTEAELRREIDTLDQAGFGGAEIQAFTYGIAPLNFSLEDMERVNSFATPSFFRHVGVAAEEALKRDMFIDYTFGSGWPFGGGDAITPELAAIELRSTHLSLEGPAKFRGLLQVPSITDGDPSSSPSALKGWPDGWAERLQKRTKVVAVVAVRGQDAIWNFNQFPGAERTVVTPGQLENGTSVDLTSGLGPDGTLKWDVPPGTWQLFVFCAVPTAQRVSAGAGPGPQLVMDHMSAEAFAAHAKRVGEAATPYIGKFFGSGVRAVFCDSLEVHANLFWSDDFLAEFRRRRGYDLAPYLPLIKMQSYPEPFGKFVDIPLFEMADIGDQVRNDYRQTVSDLMAERFYGQFNRWAHDHKLLSRTQAHGAPAHMLRIYGEADIPETEDLYGNGGYDFLKMAASAAHVYGRAIVGSESFVWRNGAYQTTPEKIKLAADELLTAGVNAVVYHGFAYSVPNILPPGWHPFNGMSERSSYSTLSNEMNPFWSYLAQLNAYITRLQFLSQVGTNVTAVALYHDDLTRAQEVLPPSPKLNQALMDAGYNYDHMNAGSLLDSTIRDRTLVSAGGACYQALVVPSLGTIDTKLAEKLVSFASAGLPILFAGCVTSRAEGLLDNDHNTLRVQTAMRSLRDLHNVYVCVNIEDAVAKLTKAANPNVKFHCKALPFIHKRIGRMNTFFVRNPSDTAQPLNAAFEAESAPELWDPWTGQVTSIKDFRRTGKYVEVNLELQPFSSALIVFDPEGVALSAITASVPGSLKRTKEIGASGWKLDATGVDASGKTAVISRDLPLLVDWSLDSELRGFSGRGVYTTIFAMPAADRGSRLILDLGNVRDVAEVKVNGKVIATLLLRPYQTDITDFVQPGENRLQVSVTNALFNSMALREPRTFRAGQTENPSGLMSAGLIGPVQLKIMS